MGLYPATTTYRPKGTDKNLVTNWGLRLKRPIEKQSRNRKEPKNYPL